MLQCCSCVAGLGASLSERASGAVMRISGRCSSPQALALQSGDARQREALLPSCSSQAWRGCQAQGCCTACCRPPCAEGPSSHHPSHCREVLQGAPCFHTLGITNCCRSQSSGRLCAFLPTTTADLREMSQFSQSFSSQYHTCFFPKHIIPSTFYNMHCQIRIVNQLIKLYSPFHLISKYLIQFLGLSEGGYFIFFPVMAETLDYVDVSVAEFGLSHVL